MPPCDEPPVESNLGVVADTADWPVYEDEVAGFRIRYPPGWTFDDASFDSDGGDTQERVESVVFSSPDVHGDFIWRINVHPVGYVWSSSTEFPLAGNDRFWRDEPVAVSGVAGLHHVTITCKGDQLRADTIVLEHAGKTYVIKGGPDTAFESFYASLEMLD